MPLFLSGTSEIIPTRNFNMTYILFDCLFLVFIVTLLISDILPPLKN